MPATGAPPDPVLSRDRSGSADTDLDRTPPAPATEITRAERWVWVAALAVHLLFWISLRTHWLVPLFNDTVHRFGPGCDFFALYQAGWNALHGESIYQFPQGKTVIPYAYPFRYLPASAYTVGALLTAVPPTTAYALWLGLCELCLAANVRLTYTQSGGGLRGARLAALWLVFMPYFLELWVGQFTFLLGSLLFWSVLGYQEGRLRAAQGWWIVSVLWKPASILWLPLWLRERRLWAGAALCGGLVAANVIYFVFFPADRTVFFETNLSATPTWHAGNIGLSGLIYHFTGRDPFPIVRMAFTGLLVLPALWVTLRGLPGIQDRPTRPKRKRSRVDASADTGASFWLLAAIWTTLYFLVYKDVWEHHLTLLLPFLVLGLWKAPSRLLVCLTLLFTLPSLFVFYDVRSLGFNVDPQPHFSPEVSLLHHSWRVVPLLVLYLHWVRSAWNLRA